MFIHKRAAVTAQLGSARATSRSITQDDVEKRLWRRNIAATFSRGKTICRILLPQTDHNK